MNTYDPPALPVCHVHNLGVVPYQKGRALQEQMAAEITSGLRPPTLLLLEHPHTFTFGRRGQADNLLWSESELKKHGVQLFWVDRGGDVTYHGPGQLVGYPLLPLGKLDSTGRLPQADYVGYIRQIEKTLIKVLASLGLISGQIPGLTGVWVQPDVASRCPRCPPEARRAASKIAAIGIKVDAQGISRHGFALNVNPDMSFWEGIVACGLVDYPSIALADLLEPVPSMQSVSEAVVTAFGEVFGYRMKIETS